MDINTLKPIALQTRLIYPFFFKPHSLPEALEALMALSQKRDRGERERQVAVWELLDKVPELYKQELMSPAKRFLFANDDCSDCRYLRLSHECANAWFKNRINVLLPVNNKKVSSVKLLPKTGVELFLSPFGVGILSLGFEVLLPDAKIMDGLDDYKVFNYYLAQLRRKHTAPVFTFAKALEDLNKADENRTIAERLGHASEQFRLAELCDYLLQGLEGELAFKPLQKQFSVYTVARFSQQVDFSKPEIRHHLGAFLSGMAQVEELNHAGHIEGEALDISHHIMNTRHWAAMSYLGAAHFVADQGIEFDNQRQMIVSHKYFVAYLAAFYQRLILQRLLDHASLFAHQGFAKDDSDKEKQQYNDDFCELHTELLNFSVTGLFTEISSREALNRYYKMSQSAFAIDKNLGHVSRAIQSYDANQVTKGLSENIEQISKIQGSVEWFQVLFVIGATTQLTEYIGDLAGKTHIYSTLSMVIAPIVTAALSLFILRPWKNDPDYQKNKKSIKTLVLTIGLIFVLWWVGAALIGWDKTDEGTSKGRLKLGRC